MKLLACWAGNLVSRFAVTALVVALTACTASPPSEFLTYRSSDGTYIHFPTSGGRFYFSSNEAPSADDEATDLAGNFQSCSNDQFACASLGGIILALPKRNPGAEWSYLGSDFRREVSTGQGSVIPIAAYEAGEKYAGFTFQPHRGIVRLDLGIYGSEDFREFELQGEKGLLAAP